MTSPVADGSNKGVQGQRLFAFSPNSFERLDASLNSSNSFDAFLFTNLSSSSVEPMSVTKIPSTAPTQPLATLVASTSSETVLHSVRPSLGMAPAGHGMQVPSVLTTPGGQVLQSSPAPACSVPGGQAEQTPVAPPTSFSAHSWHGTGLQRSARPRWGRQGQLTSEARIRSTMLISVPISSSNTDLMAEVSGS